ncbi:MAG TPA: hypothetical protein VM580_35395 [Labilithrix sp.]|nr:hypothetical protein [Labilithrix sp.]
MRDQRLRVFRTAVDSLLESLEAIVRLSRWTEAEPRPEPLVTAAAKVQERLGAADRLAASRYNGPPAAVAKVTFMCGMMKRLDAAFLTYCKNRDSGDAANALEAEISAVADIVRSSA